MNVLVAQSCPDSFATPWTAARQAPLSMGFPRQKYWSGLPFPSPGDLPNPGIEPRSPALQVKSLPSESPGVLVEKTPLPVQETQETWVRSLALEKEMATDSSILAWRIPWTEEPVRL